MPVNTHAFVVREAFFARLLSITGFPAWAVTVRTPGGQEPHEIPLLGVYMLRDRMSAEGQGNAGHPQFVHDTTIALTVIDKGEEPEDMEGSIDARVDKMLVMLLTDATLRRGDGRLAKAPGEAWTLGELLFWDRTNKRATKVATGNVIVGRAMHNALTTDGSGIVSSLFESFEMIDRQRIYPGQGETNYQEVRVTFTVRYRSDWEPVVDDDFLTIHVESRYPDHDVDPAEVQQVVVEYDIPQN